MLDIFNIDIFASLRLVQKLFSHRVSDNMLVADMKIWARYRISASLVFFLAGLNASP